MTIPHK